MKIAKAKEQEFSELSRLQSAKRRDASSESKKRRAARAHGLISLGVLAQALARDDGEIRKFFQESANILLPDEKNRTAALAALDNLRPGA